MSLKIVCQICKKIKLVDQPNLTEVLIKHQKCYMLLCPKCFKEINKK